MAQMDELTCFAVQSFATSDQAPMVMVDQPA